MAKRLKRTYWYYHAESDTIFWSHNNPDIEPNPDGCVEPISRQRARQLARETAFNKDSTFEDEWELIINKYNDKS
jgi:hypothetical protein